MDKPFPRDSPIEEQRKEDKSDPAMRAMTDGSTDGRIDATAAGTAENDPVLHALPDGADLDAPVLRALTDGSDENDPVLRALTDGSGENDPVLRALASIRNRFGPISAKEALEIFMAEGGTGLFPMLPEVLNRRVRAVNTSPAEFSKDEIARMVLNPACYEQELRAVSSSLASSTRTYDLMVQTYQGLMKYCWYVVPTAGAGGRTESRRVGVSTGAVSMVSAGTVLSDNKKVSPRTVPSDNFIDNFSSLPLAERYDLANSIARKIDPEALGHQILGLCILYGKVFFTPQVAVQEDGTVEYAFLQQLPEDFCKITGRSDSPGRYTVAFDLSYFDLPGTDPTEYGTLFAGMLSEGAKGWVQLPPESVLTFEVNDCSVAAAPPMTGLMVSMTQIPAYEAAQMEIVLNPLTSVMTGELETEDSKSRNGGGDPVRVSPATRRIFEALWYRMLERSNTNGIGLFLAPAKNLKLQTVSDTVANTEIASSAIGEQILKSGLSALIPTTTDPKVDVASLSAAVHARYGLPIYRTLERFFNDLFEQLGLGMRFQMFGDIFTWDAELENAKEGMLAGRSIDRMKYAAMQGLTLREEQACEELTAELCGYTDRQSETAIASASPELGQ